MGLKEDAEKMSDKDLIGATNFYKALCRGTSSKWDNNRYDILLRECDKRGLIK